MMSLPEQEVARAVLEGEARGDGAVGHNEECKRLFRVWQSKGWMLSVVDRDGDRIYWMTEAGRAALRKGTLS